MTAAQRREWLLTVAALVAVVGLAHWPAVGGSFLDWDDDRYFVNNPLWHGPVGAYVAAALSRVQFQAYHPLHLLSYLPDRLLWAGWPAGFHLVNLVLFVATLVWLVALLRRHVSWPAALLAVALVGAHPLLAEPVAWITGRKEVLALLFVVAALWFEDRSEGRFSPLVLLLSLAAYLTKSATMVLPLLIFAWQRWVRGRAIGHAVVRALPAAVPAIIAGVAVTSIWTSQAMVNATRPLPVVWDVAATLAAYGRRLFWPSDLSPVYPATGVHPMALAVAFVVGAALAVLGWRRLPAPARFALVAFFGALIPVSNVVPLYYRFADRYAAVALVALAWPAARGIEWVRQRSRAALPVVLVGIGACVVVTHGLAGAWRDSLSLWTRAARVQPRALFAHVKLGEARRAAGQWSAAAGSYVDAVHADPTSLLGYVGLFTALCEQAEREGRVPTGSTQRWSRDIAAAIGQPAALEELAAQIEPGCPPCARSLDWLRLVVHPRPDAQLIDAARVDLAAGRPERALVELLAVKDRSAPEFMRVYREARASGRHPFQR